MSELREEDRPPKSKAWTGDEGKDEEQVKQEEQETVEKNEQKAEERTAISATIVHKAIQREGEDELKRPSSALAWSALAAGLSMGFSFVAEALIHSMLPDVSWRPLFSKFGYSVGFLIVILGRQQLFTENTLTVILPLLHKYDGATFKNVCRLWAIVLSCNLLGALVFATAISHSNAFQPSVQSAFAEIGHHALEADFGTTLLRGIFAGWLIALMVWLLPFAAQARVSVIILITFVVGLGGFPHIIAGSIEAMYAALTGTVSWDEAVGGYMVPALLGNVLGGVALVAMVNHAQVVAGGGKDC